MSEPLPTAIVTGFLGSGKTTFINHVLSRSDDRRVAVIVNEFGDIGIDPKLLSRQSEEIVELSNGCVCCTLQKDLVTTISGLLRDRRFDYLLVETSGIADPQPLVLALQEPALVPLVRLDAVVTVVDAVNFDANLGWAEAAFGQIAAADILLLNKVDLVAESLPARMEHGLRKVNADAPVIRCSYACTDLWSATELVTEATLQRCDRPSVQSESVDNTFESIAFRADRPLDLERFRLLLQRLPSRIARAKGVLYVSGCPNRMIFHRVNEDSTLEQGQTWSLGEDRRNEIVFIGRRMDRAQLLSDLEACIV